MRDGIGVRPNLDTVGSKSARFRFRRPDVRSPRTNVGRRDGRVRWHKLSSGSDPGQGRSRVAIIDRHHAGTEALAR